MTTALERLKKILAEPETPADHPFDSFGSALRRVEKEDSPACGHGEALVLLTVEGQGQLCGDCWRRWVRGDTAWPAQSGHDRGQP